MASDADVRIDLRGDGRVILYKRDNLKDPVWQARVRVPNSTGYKRITTKTSDQREAERFALNYYEELYIHVKTGSYKKFCFTRQTQVYVVPKTKRLLSKGNGRDSNDHNWAQSGHEKGDASNVRNWAVTGTTAF